jgi:hypothetical protein
MKFKKHVRSVPIASVVRLISILCQRSPSKKYMTLHGIVNGTITQVVCVLRSTCLPANAKEETLPNSPHGLELPFSRMSECIDEGSGCCCSSSMSSISIYNNRHPPLFWFGTKHNFESMMYAFSCCGEQSKYSKHFIVSNTSKVVFLDETCTWG